MADFAAQRKNMVESQVRPSDVTDRRIVAAFLDIPRERFLPEALRAVAYMDGAIRLRPERAGVPARGLHEARTFARLLQLASIAATDTVLDVGSACGYSAAVIAKLAKTVVGLESDADLMSQAEASLKEHPAPNLTLVRGPLAQGCSEQGPYDVIVLEGAVKTPPQSLLAQLKDSGRLVAIESKSGAGKAVIWRRYGESFDRRESFDAAAPELAGFAEPATFRF